MLKKSEWFEQLFNNSGVGIFIVDENRKILDANEALCKMFGYKYNELVNQSAEFLHINRESYKNFAKVAFNKVLSNESLNLEYQFKHKNGKFIWIKISGDSIQLNHEVLWTVVDITSRIEAQNRVNYLNDGLTKEIKQQLEILREKDRQLQYQARLAKMGEMLSMIAHQWRQPLTAISATTSYMYGKLSINLFDKEEFLEELGHIEDYSKHLSKTIDDFRNFFKPNKTKEDTTLENIIKTTLEIVKPILLNNNIVVIEEFACNKVIHNYANEIRQVVLNLIKNAEDALVANKIKNSVITIRTYADKYNAVLEVSDNAGGVPLDIMDKIFDSYFTTKISTLGTGLGLCMSKTIVEDNCKGKLRVKNGQEGAIFIVSIPLMDN
jgi:PAS domain S-box-containing protein